MHPQRPRPRIRSAVDRAVNGRLYRLAWIVVVVPLLAAAFTITRPAPLPSTSQTLEPAFDSTAARVLARDFAKIYPDRSPGSPAAPGAARWVRDQLTALGRSAKIDTFDETIPGRGRVELQNVVWVVPGRSRDTIVVVAHRDTTRGSAGINDNASGTGALIELARAYAATPTAVAGGISPNHTLVFASTDAGAYGLLGARQLARHSPYVGRVVAVVVLDSIGSKNDPRLEISGHGPHSPAPMFVATAAARIADESGREPDTLGVFGQIIDLAFPFSLYEQDAFLAERIPAVTITTEGSRPPVGAGADRLDGARLGQVGRAAEGIVASLDASLEPARGTSSYVYANGRVIRGWALVFLYLAMLFPFFLALVDLLVRMRRRHVRLLPAARSYGRRLAFSLWAGAVFYVLAMLGAWPSGAAAAVNPASEAAGHWPRLSLAVLTIVLLVSWLVARTRLVRHGPAAADEEEVAALAVALSAIAVVAFVLIAANPYALLFILPSAHAWLWLIELRRSSGLVRAVLYVAGLAGPLVLLGSFMVRFGLGLDAPWYLAVLVAIGYVPPVAIVLVLAWVAAAAQVLSVIVERYSPYPAPEDRPARGPIGGVVVALRGARHDRRESS